VDAWCAPQWVLAAYPLDQIAQVTINVRSPSLFLDFQRQNALKPVRCQRKTVSGFTT
jgi:hypothetical protein